MDVFVCTKCRYTDLADDSSDIRCQRCGGQMIPLDVDSAGWNALDVPQRETLINNMVPETASDDTKNETPDQADRKIENDIKESVSSEEIPETSGKTGANKRSIPIRKTVNSIKPGAVLVALIAVCLSLALITQYRYRAFQIPITQQAVDTAPVIPPVSAGTDDKPDTYEFDNCLYYNSINVEDREIYQMFYDLVMHKDENGYSRTITLDRFEYEQRESLFFPIYAAMLSDHPEFFFLQSSGARKLGIRTVTTGVTCVVTFSLSEGEPDENEQIARFKSATKRFMADIDLNASEPEIELQIHDKLIETVTYDFDLLSGNSHGDLGFTAYGALVEDSGKHKNTAVCAGYAQAFQYLLQQAGIEAAYVSGYADSESGTLSEQGSHAWNLVKLDGEWYEVDSCWDDLDPPPDEPDKDLYKIIQYEQPQYFNATHHWYNRTTEEMRFLPAGTNTTIRIQQGNTIWELSPCSVSTHIRKREESDEDYDLFVYLNKFLPQASGTKHAL